MSITKKSLKNLAENMAADSEVFLNADGTAYVDSSDDETDTRPGVPLYKRIAPPKKAAPKLTQNASVMLEMYSEVSRYVDLLASSRKEIMDLTIELNREESAGRISRLNLSTALIDLAEAVDMRNKSFTVNATFICLFFLYLYNCTL